jgi:hypothetical protein
MSSDGQNRKEGDLLHQLLVERRPRTRNGVVVCLVIAFVGLILLVIATQSGSAASIGAVGVFLLVPFGFMAAKGALHLLWVRWRRGRSD